METLLDVVNFLKKIVIATSYEFINYSITLNMELVLIINKLLKFSDCITKFVIS